MSEMNPLWGAPRIHGELLKLGIDVCEATVAKYMARRQRPPSQTWRTFLANHIDQIAAADFFVVPTITYRLLFVLVILAHQRRRVAHVAVTAHPTAAWTAQQFREAFPEETAPRYLIHDRDHAFAALRATASGMGIEELRTAPRSPWQNAYAERLIGSIRRECLDHVIVVNETGLARVLRRYLAYYHHSRTHLSLAKDSPTRRPIARPAIGPVVAIPQVGGLHHRYDRRAASLTPPSLPGSRPRDGRRSPQFARPSVLLRICSAKAHDEQLCASVQSTSLQTPAVDGSSLGANRVFSRGQPACGGATFP
jgi:transposase InsO family protein